MDLLLVRDVFTPTSTTGTLSIDGKPFGFALEDFDRGLHATYQIAYIRRVKVARATAIPYGRYSIRKTWSPRYGRFMPEVCDVPGFQGIRIHAGNDAGDTDGCILPGKSRARNRVYTSAAYAAWLEKEILRVLDSGAFVHLTIQRSPDAPHKQNVFA